MKYEELYTYKAQYVKNYDGDTITFLVDLGFKISFEIRVRLLGINTPEIKSSIVEERELAKKARDFVKSELTNADCIFLKTYKDRKGKYGRYLGHVEYEIVDESGHGHVKHLTGELIENELGEEYV